MFLFSGEAGRGMFSFSGEVRAERKLSPYRLASGPKEAGL